MAPRTEVRADNGPWRGYERHRGGLAPGPMPFDHALILCIIFILDAQFNFGPTVKSVCRPCPVTKVWCDTQVGCVTKVWCTLSTQGSGNVRNPLVSVCMLPRSSQNRIFRFMEPAMLICR